MCLCRTEVEVAVLHVHMEVLICFFYVDLLTTDVYKAELQTFPVCCLLASRMFSCACSFSFFFGFGTLAVQVYLSMREKFICAVVNCTLVYQLVFA